MKKTAPTLLVAALASSAAIANLSESETRFDINGDDRLDEEERQAMVALQGTLPSAADSRIRSRNGPSVRQQIQDNIDQRRRDRFLTADTSGDELLSPVEFTTIPAAARLGTSHATGLFARLDQNADDFVSLAEFTSTLTDVKNAQ